MENSGLVKSEKDVFVMRISQVRKININLPAEDKGSSVFYNCLFGGTKVEVDGNLIIRDVLVGDAYTSILNCLEICRKNKYDDRVLTLILSVFTTFRNMTFVDFTFVKNSSLVSDCLKILDEKFDGDKSELFERVYKVKEMEIHLSDSLNVEAIDYLNRMFMFFEFIPNDYMKREFCIDFEFDEYVNFMSMLLSNNKELVKIVGKENISHLSVFPGVAERSKPMLKIVTNYRDL